MEPQTRRESKKDKKTKAGEKYGQKHVRILEALTTKKHK
jgi:ATP-dependent RNA circularization protein (DNA/RNA ligase family)